MVRLSSVSVSHRQLKDQVSFYVSVPGKAHNHMMLHEESCRPVCLLARQEWILFSLVRLVLRVNFEFWRDCSSMFRPLKPTVWFSNTLELLKQILLLFKHTRLHGFLCLLSKKCKACIIRTLSHLPRLTIPFHSKFINKHVHNHSLSYSQDT